MSKDDNNPLRKLVNAEREANEIIAREERYRSKRLQEAEYAVQDIYEKRRAEEETKFQQEVLDHDGAGGEKLKALEAEVSAQKADQDEKFNAHKDSAVELLLHYVGTCDTTLSESQKQAFLAIQREKAVPEAN